MVISEFSILTWALTLFPLALTLIILYYVLSVSKVKKPKLFTRNKKFEAFLIANLPILQEKYKPSWYGWEGRIQTILGTLRPSQNIEYQREIRKLQDGGQLALDFLEPPNSDTQDEPPPLVVLLLPGLTSSSKDAYIQSISLAAQDVGAVISVMNQRGLGGLSLKTPRTNCATKHEDLIEIISYIQKKYLSSKMVGIGCSLGGMQLCHYIMSYPEEAKENFTAALVLSVCWDSLGTMINLESSLINNYVFNLNLTKNLQRLITRHRPILEQRSDILNFDKILSCRTMREFDRHYTAPQFGYKDELDYYRDGHAARSIASFSIPVLALNSRDDPMARRSDLPVEKALAEGFNFALIVTKHGGHLGFMESSGIFSLKKRRFHFMERLVIQWLSAVRKYPNELTNCRANR